MRLEGWEIRLPAMLEAAARKPYGLGEHDCFSVACEDVKLLTGVDRWPEFKGYRTKREALALLARHGSTFEAAFDWFFGVERSTWMMARRGDILMIQSDDGEKHLGVCNGSTIAGLREDGMAFFQLSAGLCCWKVG